MKKVFGFLLFLGCVSFFPFAFVFAVAQEINFNVDKDYDLYQREEVLGELVRVTNHFYFFVDKNWWEQLSEEKKNNFSNIFYELATEFEYKVYPQITQSFGSEPKPGIDEDPKMYLLFHPMAEDVGGYTRECDLVAKNRCPSSNEKEIIFLNTYHITSPLEKIFLAHEFFHLVSLNQKLILRGVKEDIWLEEARADFSGTFLGFSKDLPQILQERVKTFSKFYSDSLVEWKNTKKDYASVSLFLHYFVDRFGPNVLADALKSEKIGIESLNFALAKNKFSENFETVFRDWLITIAFPDCRFGEKFCYKEEIFRQIKISPPSFYLPKENGQFETSFTVTYFQPIFLKFFTPANQLEVEIEGEPESKLEGLYFLCDFEERCRVFSFPLENQKHGKIVFSDFAKDSASVMVAFFEKGKLTDFSSKEKTFEVKVRAKTGEKVAAEKSPSTPPTISPAPKEDVSEVLKKLWEAIQGIFAKKPETFTPHSPSPSISCKKIETNLYFGMRKNPQVKCLQEFFVAKEPDLYPEKLVTGNFFYLTKAAVVRFQEKYKKEILEPLGLKLGTGFVGPLTRQKINELLK